MRIPLAIAAVLAVAALAVESLSSSGQRPLHFALEIAHIGAEEARTPGECGAVGTSWRRSLQAGAAEVRLALERPNGTEERSLIADCVN